MNTHYQHHLVALALYILLSLQPSQCLPVRGPYSSARLPDDFIYFFQLSAVAIDGGPTLTEPEKRTVVCVYVYCYYYCTYMTSHEMKWVSQVESSTSLMSRDSDHVLIGYKGVSRNEVRDHFDRGEFPLQEGIFGEGFYLTTNFEEYVYLSSLDTLPVLKIDLFQSS